MDFPRLEKVPSVAAVMTPFPFSVAADAPITAAEALMEQHGIRHVPVRDGETLVGVITERDVALLVDTSLPVPERARIPVHRICSAHPYMVDMHESLGTVTREMAARRVDCALVLRDARLVGIFTSSDACRVLAEILGSPPVPERPDEAA